MHSKEENTHTGAFLFTCETCSLFHFPGKKKKPDECAVERGDELSVLLNHFHVSCQAEEVCYNWDSLCSQGHKRSVFGWTPRIFRLFSGQGLWQPREGGSQWRLCGMACLEGWNPQAPHVTESQKQAQRLPHKTWLHFGMDGQNIMKFQLLC